MMGKGRNSNWKNRVQASLGFPALIFCCFALACSATQGSKTPSKGPLRLILNGGAVPTADVVVTQRMSLEAAPFDGIIFALQAGRVPFQNVAFSPAVLSADRRNLPLINSSHLTDNFLLIRGGVDATFDRFSDLHWTKAISNVRIIAQMAKLGQLKGIAFDPEAYANLGQKSLFDYRTYDSVLPENAPPALARQNQDLHCKWHREYD